jgi:anaerobic selenocysteine-containing dehydrogenase
MARAVIATRECQYHASQNHLLLGTNMLSSFADAGHIADGLNRAELVISVDLFMNETARRFAHVVLPGTAWLEELGFKVTNTHLYLMERALGREGETRPIYEILISLAKSLGLADFFPWGSLEEVLDAILDHSTTGHATVTSLRAAGGFLPLKVPHVAMPIETSTHRPVRSSSTRRRRASLGYHHCRCTRSTKRIRWR